jgi:hypothetical protein
MNLTDYPTPRSDATWHILETECIADWLERSQAATRQLEREAAALLAICERYRAGTVDIRPREYGDQEFLDEIGADFDALKSQLTKP